MFPGTEFVVLRPSTMTIGDNCMDLQQKRNDILRIAARHGARNLRVFGSVARGDDRAHSDVDLLVDMDSDRSLLDLVGLGQDLEELLQRRVDVLTAATLHPALRDRILAESRPL
jgi:predicted nucleotidyltransferase